MCPRFILCKITGAGVWQLSYAESCHKLFTQKIHEANMTRMHKYVLKSLKLKAVMCAVWL